MLGTAAVLSSPLVAGCVLPHRQRQAFRGSEQRGAGAQQKVNSYRSSAVISVSMAMAMVVVMLHNQQLAIIIVKNHQSIINQQIWINTGKYGLIINQQLAVTASCWSPKHQAPNLFTRVDRGVCATAGAYDS